MNVLIVGMVVSYLVGSIPTAYIFGYVLKGIDIRKHGSGNVGATNVFRVLGKWPGILVLLLDIYKGYWMVAVAADVLGLITVGERILIAMAVVLGHNYTVFLKFKGGKGVATSCGVLIGLAVRIAAIRLVLIVTLLSFLIVFLTSRIVSLSSIIAAIVFPLASIVTKQEREIIILSLLFCGFIIYRHLPNIKRLFANEEPKVPLWGKR